MKINRFLSTTMLGLALAAGTPALQAAPSGLDLARQLNEAFVSVADTVSKSVVVIEVSGKASRMTSNDSRWFDMLPPGMRDQFEEFFERRQPREQTPSQRERLVPQGSGSGVIISEDGYILTNNHVVENADKISVRLHDGKIFTATVQGTDSESDVAVIKIDAKGLPVAKLGDSSKTRVGEFAIAIGAPFSLNYSVTVGHVSAKGRQVFSSQMMMDQDFIQTDASINPGNSGGPLVNLEGEVIGINTLIRGMNTGIGFAVPINLAKDVSTKLISEGKFTRAWLGIEIAGLSERPELRETFKGVKEGVAVIRIRPDGPAANSDIEPGDVIVAVDGRTVTSAVELKNEIRSKKIGADVRLDVIRDGKKEKLVVQPGDYAPEDQQVMSRSSKPGRNDASVMGMKVETLSPQLAKQYGVGAKSGVIVTEVEAGSLAEERGIQPGDVISKVNRTEVTNAREFRDAMQSADSKAGIRLSIENEQGRQLNILKEDGE